MESCYSPVQTPRPYCQGPCACSGACYFTDAEWYLWLAYGVPRNSWDSEAEQYPYGRCAECQGKLEPKYATTVLRCILCNRPTFAGTTAGSLSLVDSHTSGLAPHRPRDL